jgi:UDP-N-acetylmuramoyl-L-alanyl-D-glutamate--2,6-diaminopimelate ligase
LYLLRIAARLWELSHPNFFGNPSEKMKLTGVTGTNGKTTVATLLYKLFAALGHRSGLISTVENRIVDASSFLPRILHQDPIQLNELLRRMVEEKCTHVFMEVSSHAIDQGAESQGLKFVGALFTNITHDHLDYHLTFENYIKAKKNILMS